MQLAEALKVLETALEEVKNFPAEWEKPVRVLVEQVKSDTRLMQSEGGLALREVKRVAELEQQLADRKDADKVHASILRGTIALTKAQAIHIAGLPADVEQRLTAAEGEARQIPELRRLLERASDRLNRCICDENNSIYLARQIDRALTSQPDQPICAAVEATQGASPYISETAKPEKTAPHIWKNWDHEWNPICEPNCPACTQAAQQKERQ